MKQLSEPQKKFLRGLGHDLKPVVMVGASGLKDTIIKEIDGALEHHELIKVKIASSDRDDKKKIIEKIVTATSGITVQQIGGILLLFRRNYKKPKIEIPKH